MIPKYVIIGSDDKGNRMHKILHNFINDNYKKIKIYDINENLYPNIVLKMNNICQNLLYNNKCSVDELVCLSITESYMSMASVSNKFPFMRCIPIDNINNISSYRTHSFANSISISNKCNLSNIINIFENFIKAPTHSECKCSDCLDNGKYSIISKLLVEIDMQIFGIISSPK